MVSFWVIKIILTLIVGYRKVFDKNLRSIKNRNLGFDVMLRFPSLFGSRIDLYNDSRPIDSDKFWCSFNDPTVKIKCSANKCPNKRNTHLVEIFKNKLLLFRGR